MYPLSAHHHQAVYCDLYFPSNEEGGGRGGNEGREQRKNNVREVYIQVIPGLLTLNMLKVPLNIKILKCLFWNDSSVEWIWISLFATEWQSLKKNFLEIYLKKHGPYESPPSMAHSIPEHHENVY